MKNCLKCNHNLNTITVFSSIEGITTHLANIDTRTNRIYTTKEGYELIGTDSFKVNHKVEWFDMDVDSNQAPYRKFPVSVSFGKHELLDVVAMCSRELVF